MSLKVALKLVTLLTALTATVVAIFWLKQSHMDSFWTSLGINRGGTRINWCIERVDSLYLYESKSKLIEEAGKWIWQSGDKKAELDYLRVEKWFAKYCQVPVDSQLKEKSETSETLKPFFEVKFVDQSRKTLSRQGDNHFEIGDQYFQSETLRKGIKELLAFSEKIE